MNDIEPYTNGLSIKYCKVHAQTGQKGQNYDPVFNDY